jgi:hypothetical protein
VYHNQPETYPLLKKCCARQRTDVEMSSLARCQKPGCHFFTLPVLRWDIDYLFEHLSTTEHSLFQDGNPAIRRLVDGEQFATSRLGFACGIISSRTLCPAAVYTPISLSSPTTVLWYGTKPTSFPILMASRMKILPTHLPDVSNA